MHGIGLLLVVAALAVPAREPVAVGASVVIGAVRPLEARAARILDHGVARSASFRRLMASAGAGTIVYVAMDAHLASGLRGVTRLMGASAGVTRMVIVLNPRACDDDLAAVLGHELQHVAEMTAARVTTTAEVDAHYRTHGIRGYGGRFETIAALEAGARVLMELASAPGK